MRDSEADTPTAPRARSALHIDASRGVTAARLLGALAAVTDAEGAVRQAFERGGLQRLGLGVRFERAAACGLKGTRAIVTLGGAPLAPAPSSAETSAASERGGGKRATRARAQHSSVERAPAWHAAARGADAAAAAHAVQRAPVPGTTHLSDDDAPGGTAPAQSAAIAGHVEPLAAWLNADAAVTLLELETAVSALALAPLTHALARRVVGALTAGAAHVDAEPRRLAGRVALRVLCELVAIAAVVDTLAPVAVTASAVGLSPRAAPDALELRLGGAQTPALAPAPLILELLAGIPVVRDESASSTDALGAAWLATLCRRSAARGVAAPYAQGVGVADDDDRPGVTRVILEERVDLRTSNGLPDTRGVQLLEAELLGVDAPEDLVEQLERAGALSPVIRGPLPAHALGGHTSVSVVRAACPTAAVEEVCAVLYRAGARSVDCGAASRLVPQVQDVTVTVRLGTLDAVLPVRLYAVGGESVGGDAHDGPLRAAAQRAGVSVSAARAAVRAHLAARGAASAAARSQARAARGPLHDVVDDEAPGRPR